MRKKTPLSLLLPFLLIAAAVGAAPAAGGTILVTEVVTDPQADHSESSGGNGVPFDLVPGAGTVSSVDEFIEVHNAGTETIDLTNYRLVFRDTSPSSYRFGTTSAGILLFSEGSVLDSFAPGAYAVLGNPPGALNNKLDIDILDPTGTLIDGLRITDGNAASASDEAVHRLWTGTAYLSGTSTGPITPLGPPEPVPEPASVFLLGASVLAAARSIARRGSRARRRRPA